MGEVWIFFGATQSKHLLLFQRTDYDNWKGCKLLQLEHLIKEFATLTYMDPEITNFP